VEIWDGDALVITRTTPRPWDCLGDTFQDSAGQESEGQNSGGADGDGGPVDAVQPHPTPLPASLPRRAPSLFASSLSALGAKTGWQKIVSRRTKA
jgi:hypothetical protein